MARRSKARELVLQMLFQVDLNPDIAPAAVRAMIDERLDADLRAFAWSLYTGVNEFRTLLDERIQAIAPHWRLSRMAATDRNVLRLGAFELIQTDTPLRVVINEALDLARKFGTDQSAQFVNGVLDKLVPGEKRNRPEAEQLSTDEIETPTTEAEPSESVSPSAELVIPAEPEQLEVPTASAEMVDVVEELPTPDRAADQPVAVDRAEGRSQNEMPGAAQFAGQTVPPGRPPAAERGPDGLTDWERDIVSKVRATAGARIDVFSDREIADEVWRRWQLLPGAHRELRVIVSFAQG